MCDPGRYGFGDLDAPTRLCAPGVREADGTRAVEWPELIAALAERLRAAGPDGLGVLLSPRMANEDLWLARRLVGDVLGARALDFRVPPRTPGLADDLLMMADKHPNTRGAELLGCGRGDATDGAHVLDAARAGRLRLLWVFHHDLLETGWPAADVTAALDRVECLVFQGPNANATSARAHLLVPSAAYVEREGTFTSGAGRVQRFWRAVPPLAEARADWEILAEAARALGQDWRPARAEHVFRELAAAVPAFGGLTYRGLGDHGAGVASRGASHRS
jgi:predicted molibdopterin-dependent oxidoreductase YjgC